MIRHDHINRIVSLLRQRLFRKETSSELEDWAAERPENQAILDWTDEGPAFMQELREFERLRAATPAAWERLAARSKNALGNTELAGNAEQAGPEVRPLRRLLVRGVSAAAVLLLIVLTTWLVLRKGERKSPPVVQQPVRDIQAPAASRAVITLAGGQQLYLDSAVHGLLAQQGETRLIKEEDGRIAYKADHTGQGNHAGEGKLFYNTLSNPRGSPVVSLVLSDGTRVWLNAATTLKYPAYFSGNDRRVEVSGEAYFEVAQEPHRPFTVSRTGDALQVQVLGTAFNIDAYADGDPTRVTLLNGAVRVGRGGFSRVLRPGQQAELGPGGALTLIAAVDTGAVMAWKNGLFSFEGADLRNVMRKLGRWYDVEVEYQGAPSGLIFHGEIGKDLSLDQVLKGLAHTHVNYEIVNPHKIIVRP